MSDDDVRAGPGEQLEEKPEEEKFEELERPPPSGARLAVQRIATTVGGLAGLAALYVYAGYVLSPRHGHGDGMAMGIFVFCCAFVGAVSLLAAAAARAKLWMLVVAGSAVLALIAVAISGN